MNNLYKKLNKESDHIRLTDTEKAAMRANVFGAPSPVRPVRSPFVFISTHRVMVALTSLVLVVFAGTSTVYAAQGALPGAPLYGLKTNVLEPIEVALASTPAEKAKVESSIASRRVAEAQELAAEGRLDATTTREIEDNFNEHASRALAFAGEGQPTATTSVAAAPVSEPQKKESNRPRAATTLSVTAGLATTAPQTVSTTTEEEGVEATSTQGHKENEDVPTSIEKQRGILKELRLHVEERGRAKGSDSEESRPQTR